MNLKPAQTELWVAASLALLAAASACGGSGEGGGLASPYDIVLGGGGDASGVVDVSADCVPGQSACASVSARALCSAEGRWSELPCGAGEGCREGECVAQVCAPSLGNGSCLSDDTLERCNEAGTAWEVATCPEGTRCKSGTCVGQICTPGARICAGFTAVQECDEAGEAWRQIGACPTGSACAEGACLSPCEVNIKDGSYLGCEYWAMDLDNVEEAAAHSVGLVVSVPRDRGLTEVTISNMATGQVLSAAELGVADLYVGPGELEVFSLPTGFDVDGTGLTTNTFELVTSSPVTVHQFNPLNGDGVFSNDASLLLPAQVIGRDYLVMSWPHRVDPVLRGFATVIATRPGVTEIRLTPSAAITAGPAVTGIAAGQTRTFQLARGQALNLETAGGDSGDLTGTLIEGSQQLTVIAGHECANIPVGINSCDHIESQLFSIDTWGTRYIADAFWPRSAAQVDLWRVMAGDNNVTVRTAPPVPGYAEFVLQRGTWVQFATGDSFEVIADGPVLVGHFLSGSSYPGASLVCASASGGETALGDPAFTLPVPTGRYLKSYAVLTPEGYREDYLNIVARPGTIVTIDGAALSTPLTPIGDSGWALARQLVAPGVHSVEGSAVFGLTAYGYDCDVSYAYPGGLKLQSSEGGTR